MQDRQTFAVLFGRVRSYAVLLFAGAVCVVNAGSAWAAHGDLACNAVAPGQPPDPVYCDELNVAQCNCAAELSAVGETCDGSAPAGFDQQKNILWMMADDQAYCMYGFMHQPGASSVEAPGQLRVNDLGCRYRNSEGDGPETFKFGLDRFSPVDLGPCNQQTGQCMSSFCKETGPQNMQACDPNNPGQCASGQCLAKPCSQDSDCRIFSTPTLDRLAAEGAVFPVAHVPAHNCIPAWKGVAIGRHAKDAQGATSASGLEPCECAAGCSTGGNDCGSQTLSSQNDNCTGSIGCSCANACENTRTFARLLHENDNGPAYATYMRGKFRDIDPGLHGYDDCESFKRVEDSNFGMLTDNTCGPTSLCASHVRNDYLPDGRIDTLPSPSLITPISPFVDWIKNLPLDSNYELQHPFMLGWSPENPHDGDHTNPGTVFKEVYCQDGDCAKAFGGRHKVAADNMARVTRADYMLGLLIDQLKRHCVCHAGEPTSLYDMTVVIYHTDHGAFMPQAKNSSPENNNMRGENGSRSALVISHPDQRGPSPRVKPEVYAEHLVQTIDVFRSMIDHFDDVDDAGTGGDVPSDLKGHDLWTLMSQSSACSVPADCSGGATCVNGFCRQACTIDADCPAADVCTFDGEQRSCRRRVRDVMVTQGGYNSDFAPWPGWFVRPRPGRVGICAANANGGTVPEIPGSTPRFCVVDKDCQSLGVPCQKASEGDSGAGICMNWTAGGRPIRCASDQACSSGLCDAPPETCPIGVCKVGVPGSFFDYGGTTCEVDQGNGAVIDGCVPPGVCAPPIVKYGAKSTGTPPNLTVDPSKIWIYELHSDPDETTNRGTSSLGSCLGCLLRRCAESWQAWGPAGPNATPEDVAKCFDPSFQPAQHANPNYNCASQCS